MEETIGLPDQANKARLAGRLLGCEQAWEDGGIGQRVDSDALQALARSLWEAEGRRLAGTGGDYATFLQGFLEGYAKELAA